MLIARCKGLVGRKIETATKNIKASVAITDNILENRKEIPVPE
tara:strand:- start:952 stop:1080 length:129 start_codon:yes stop_codon:yes gene_type:complete